MQELGLQPWSQKLDNEVGWEETGCSALTGASASAPHPLPMLAQGTSQKKRDERRSWKMGRDAGKCWLWHGGHGYQHKIKLAQIPIHMGKRLSRPHPPCTEELQGKGEACFFVGMKNGKFLNILVDELTSMHIQAAITGLLTYKKKKTEKKGGKLVEGGIG